MAFTHGESPLQLGVSKTKPKLIELKSYALKGNSNGLVEAISSGKAKDFF